MRFEDLLNQSLPSRDRAIMREACGADESCKANEGCKASEGCGANEGYSDDELDAEVEQDLASINLDDLDEDIEDGDAEDAMAAINGVDDEEEIELDDDEEVEADQNMALVATPFMLDDELNDECAMESFIDEFPTIVAEGFLFESDIDRYLNVESEVDQMLTEARVFASKTKVQLDEKDRRKQLFEIGVQASARAHNDPVYWKLQKCYKLERIYKAKLRQKYRGEALKRVKAYVKRLKSSTSKVLSSLGSKIIGK